MFSCCGCVDDEAWKYCECFCSCHTYAHMDRQLASTSGTAPTVKDGGPAEAGHLTEQRESKP